MNDFSIPTYHKLEDTEVDALIAEKVMGWKVMKNHFGWWCSSGGNANEFQPTRNLLQCHMVESHIEELGDEAKIQYVNFCLIELLVERYRIHDMKELALQFFDYGRMKPRLRCNATLRTLDFIEGKSDG